jgi:hypothetical protein
MNDKYVAQWTKKVSKLLLGKTITHVGYMTDDEQSAFGWSAKAVVIQLNDGTTLFPSSDDEGNGAGALFTTNENLPVIPVI